MLLLNIKCLKRKKVEFGVGNARLIEYIERLDKALKALESEHPLLTKSHDQLQTQLSKLDMPSSSTSSCDHANIIEENARLNDELAKLSSSFSNINNARATNSTSCETSILKENVELRAQLELLTSKYGILWHPDPDDRVTPYTSPRNTGYMTA